MIVNYSPPFASDAQEYLDTAIRRAAKRAGAIKSGKDPLARAKLKEAERIKEIAQSLQRSLEGIHNGYPSFDSMGEFTRQIFSLTMDPGRVKQALGGLQHVVRTIGGLKREHLDSVKRSGTREEAVRARKAFLGRIGSVMREARKHLLVLNESRAVFRDLPAIDDTLFTCAIAGFPNVGKSTLLARLTSADPEIRSYAFTTKGLNVGYFEHRYNKIQCIDTPGTLNREQSNLIEQKAEATLRYLADLIVYVFDPTEASYPLAHQFALYEGLALLRKPLLVYASKTDIASEEQRSRITVPHLCDPEKLKKRIVEEFRRWA